MGPLYLPLKRRARPPASWLAAHQRRRAVALAKIPKGTLDIILSFLKFQSKAFTGFGKRKCASRLMAREPRERSERPALEGQIKSLNYRLGVNTDLLAAEAGIVQLVQFIDRDNRLDRANIFAAAFRIRGQGIG